jgi:transcriptional regulator with AAA-type ATPase domain
MAELLFSRRGEVAFRASLNTWSVRVGRSPLNDVQVPDEAVAPFQASLDRTPEGHRLSDHSGHGTTLNGRPVASAILKPGDALTLGGFRATYVLQPVAASGHTNPLPLEPRGAAACALVTRGGRRLPVTATGIRVGKHPDNDLVLDDEHVSSFHALVFLRGGAVVVHDLGSTNGTFINSIRVGEAEAPVGATITLGHDAVTVEGEAEAPVGRSKGRGGAAVAVKTVGDLRYADPAMDGVAAAIRSVAPHDAAVCIVGESGTGKELVAQAIHQLGPRASEPFVAVNCAALSPSLVESELFGHERGAFTGADRARHGAFEEAGKGTLFLDEIGDLAPDAQAKLLRALENREVRRVGAEGSRKVLCRVIAATHRDLARQVEAGGFRNDLFHRLAVLPIHVPPLRKRPSDIPVLCAHFLRERSGRKVTLTPAAVQKLRGHAWPGNARELLNVLTRAVVMVPKDVLDAPDVEIGFSPMEERVEAARHFRPGRTLAEVQTEVMEEAVAAMGSHSAAARALGVSRTTLTAWLKNHATG